MPSFRSQRVVVQSPQQMFDLVADVEHYPEFLPFCEGLTVRNRSVDASGRPVIVATMSVGYKAIRESFTSRIVLDHPALAIEVSYIDGPFKHLRNLWNFREESGGGCRIEFFIDYEFRSRLLGILMGAMFDQAFRRFVSAFEARANAVYRQQRSSALR